MATGFLNFGSQRSMPAAICITPKIFHTVDGILPISEQGGSKKNKNLSAPIMKNIRLQIPTRILLKFIFLNLYMVYNETNMRTKQPKSTKKCCLKPKFRTN